MFVELSGNLVNTNHIAVITKENHVSLTNGSNITVTTEEAANLRHVLDPVLVAIDRAPDSIMSAPAFYDGKADSSIERDASLLADATHQESLDHHENVVLGLTEPESEPKE